MACRTAFIIAIAASLLAAPSARAQGAGEPAGIWSTQAGDARVRVSKCGGGMCGVILSIEIRATLKQGSEPTPFYRRHRSSRL